jgi:hypothetical protein
MAALEHHYKDGVLSYNSNGTLKRCRAVCPDMWPMVLHPKMWLTQTYHAPWNRRLMGAWRRGRHRPEREEVRDGV